MTLGRRARDYFAGLQDRICDRLEAFEGKLGRRFREDVWSYDADGSDRDAEGGGRTRVLSGGRTFEKAGVSLADVRGELNERLAERLDVPEQAFRASGVSLVIHPLSPMVPAVHANFRHIELLGRPRPGEDRRAWFGGGCDLTPYYLFEEDAAHFHRTLREACDRHDPAHYPRFKKECDAYFHNRHRDEARGVGGIFFDYLGGDLERTFDFVRSVGDAFLEAYVPLVERRAGEPWYDREREWQLIRRGRYVEFNLVWDRGTLFGLETRGRTESILMSLPPLVRWVYDHQPQTGSREAELVSVLREPRDWA